jgi:hypothetical protein
MDYSQDLYASWLCNYEEFFEDGTTPLAGFLADCRIHVVTASGTPPSDVIAGHRVILSNSSDFFYNTFTAGMRESETGIVEVICRPPSLFRSIVRWMYSAKLELNVGDIMNLIQVSHEYGILELEKFFVSELDTIITADNVLGFLDKCFEDQLPDAIRALEPFLANYLSEIDVKALGKVCDVTTFAKVLTKCRFGNQEKIALITQFVDADTEYELNSDDRMVLTQCLNRSEPLKHLLKPDLKWLRKGFYQTLKR